jgi:hypothetical protein
MATWPEPEQAMNGTYHLSGETFLNKIFSQSRFEKARRPTQRGRRSARDIPRFQPREKWDGTKWQRLSG